MPQAPVPGRPGGGGLGGRGGGGGGGRTVSREQQVPQSHPMTLATTEHCVLRKMMQVWPTWPQGRLQSAGAGVMGGGGGGLGGCNAGGSAMKQLPATASRMTWTCWRVYRYETA